MIRVLVAVHDRLLRECLAHILRERLDVAVVGQTSSTAATLAMTKDLGPNVVLACERMSSSPELAQQMPKVCRRTKVVALGGCGHPYAFCLKDGSIEEVVAALYEVLHTDSIVVPVDDVQQAYRLTDSELEIAQLLARGLSNKEIAQKTNRSVHTVKHHVHRVLQKLGIHARGKLGAEVPGLLQDDSTTRFRRTGECLVQ